MAMLILLALGAGGGLIFNQLSGKGIETHQQRVKRLDEEDHRGARTGAAAPPRDHGDRGRGVGDPRRRRDDRGPRSGGEGGRRRSPPEPPPRSGRRLSGRPRRDAAAQLGSRPHRGLHGDLHAQGAPAVATHPRPRAPPGRGATPGRTGRRRPAGQTSPAARRGGGCALCTDGYGAHPRGATRRAPHAPYYYYYSYYYYYYYYFLPQHVPHRRVPHAPGRRRRKQTVRTSGAAGAPGPRR